MAGNGVTIKIQGDASGLQKELSTVERSAKSAAAALGHEYARAGMTLQQGMSRAWAEVQKAQRSGQSIVINGVETIISKNEEVIKQKNNLGDVYDEIGNGAKVASVKIKAGLADIKAGIDMAAAAAKTLYGVAEKGIGYNATIEQLKTSFEVMTGSAEKAVEVTERLRTMGAETPFEMKDLASTTQLLMQYGFTADEALDRMKMLGDVAQGNVNAMNSIALGYAQMASAGKVNLVDIKQMINGGFNPLQEISERTGESMASLYDRISKGKISVDEITESMRHATSEGGRFYQSMEKQSQTLNGQLSTLKDNADQLLGSLTQGVSDGLRDQLLPFANNLVAELQGAFDAGGYQGLVDTATDMIPDLLGMMTGELQKGIEGLSRWLPKGASQLMQALPGALRMASTVTPQLTQALFEVAGSVIADLVSMLPELAPIVLEGFQDMMLAVGKGLFKSTESIFNSVFELMGIEVKKGVSSFNDVVDNEYTDELGIHIDGKVDTSSLDVAEKELAGRINTLYANIHSVLTDGKPDTKEVIDPIQEEADRVVGELLEGVNEWEQGEIDKLDPKAENYAAACETVKLEAAAMRTEIKGYHTEISNFIDSMAGKSAETVEANLGLLQSATDGLAGYVERFYDLLAESSPEAIAYKAAAAGAARDSQTVGQAIDYMYANYQKNIVDAADSYNKEIERINNEAAKGIITPNEALVQKAEAEGRKNTAITAAEGIYRDQASALMQGLMRTMTEEEQIALKDYFTKTSLMQDIANAMKGIGGILADPNMTADMLPSALQGVIPDSIVNALYSTDGYDVDPAVKEGFMNALVNGNLFDASAILTSLSGMVQDDIDDSAVDTSWLAGIWGKILNPDGHIDMSSALDNVTVDQMMTQIYSGIGQKVQEYTPAIEQQPIAVDIPIDPKPVVKENVAPTQELIDAMAGSFSNEENPVAIDLYMIPSEGALSQAENAGDTLANTTTDAIKTTGETGAKTAGGAVATGTAVGIGAKAYIAVNAAAAMARAVVAKIRQIFDSHSPSRVAMSIGGDFGEGMSIGLQKSMSNAVAVAKRMSGQIVTSADISQSMRVSMPTLTHDIIMANEQSDRSVNLYVNGRQLGRVMAADNQQAQNSYNRSIALGVGK